MTGKSVDFGVAKFRRLLLVGNFTQLAVFFMGFLGSAMAGNMLGETELSGVALMLPVGTGLSFFASLFGVGMSICYAIELGKGNLRRAREFFTQGVWSVLAVGTVFSLAIALFHPQLIGFLCPGDGVRAAATAYCRVFWTVPLVQMASVFLLNANYAEGDDRLCYAAYAVQLAVNLLVTYLSLRFGFGTGGCAAGAFAGFAASIAVLSRHFLKRSNTFRLVRHFSVRDTLTIMRTVFGDSSYYLFIAAMIFAMEKYVIAVFGSPMLPVFAVVIATFGLSDVFGGVGAAAQPVISVYFGERNLPAARRVIADALRVVVIEGIVFTAFFLLAPKAVIALAGVSDPKLVAASERAVRLLSLGMVGQAVANLLNGYYIVVGHGMLATVLSAFSWFVGPVALAVGLGTFFGADGVWLGLGFGTFVTVAAFAVYIVFRHGAAQCPYLLPSDRDERVSMWTLPLEPAAITEVSRQAAERLAAAGVGDDRVRMRVGLLVEEALMVVRERNGEKRILGEVTLDLNEGVRLTLRDDGEIFDITDADARLSSFRTYLLCTMMADQRQRENLIVTGFNRNVFRFDATSNVA